MATKPPLPPFTSETAVQKVQSAKMPSRRRRLVNSRS
jgi:nuclear transport factor 2 (NTF2) superfamily protein